MRSVSWSGVNRVLSVCSGAGAVGPGACGGSSDAGRVCSGVSAVGGIMNN
jgi:hypothetical protein